MYRSIFSCIRATHYSTLLFLTISTNIFAAANADSYAATNDNLRDDSGDQPALSSLFQPVKSAQDIDYQNNNVVAAEDARLATLLTPIKLDAQARRVELKPKEKQESAEKKFVITDLPAVLNEDNPQQQTASDVSAQQNTANFETIFKDNELTNDAVVNEVFDASSPVIEDNLPPKVDNNSVVPLENTNEIISVTPLLNGAQQNSGELRNSLMALLQASADEQTPQKTVTSVLINGNFYKLRNPQRVATFYQWQQYPIIWSNDNKINELALQLQNVIANVAADALNPKRYHEDIIKNLQLNETHNDILSYELLLSDAYLTLAGDLGNGLVNPKLSHKTWNTPPIDDYQLSNLLAQAVIDKQLAPPLQKLNDNPRYQALKQRYNNLLQEMPQQEEVQLPNKILRLADNDPAVLILRAKIGVEGDEYFDETLEEAVKNLQARYGLSADGIVGANTRKLLNNTRQDLLNALMINMERQRWQPQQMGSTYILVNIPSYKMEMIANDKVIFESKTVVGSAARPTPVFSDRLRHIVMSPTWTVPSTIMRLDKLPKLRSNPAAFDGSYVAITPGGRAVAPSAVNWNNSKGYALRQKPGPRNALGRIKFLFPNKHAIYLHDTPNKSLFSRNNRARSSGCVRLEKPFEFANILLENTEWTPEKIKKTANRNSERRVDPPQETPIYLVYWTLWADFAQQIQTAQDIYKLDGKLLKQYQKVLNDVD